MCLENFLQHFEVEWFVAKIRDKMIEPYDPPSVMEAEESEYDSNDMILNLMKQRI